MQDAAASDRCGECGEKLRYRQPRQPAKKDSYATQVGNRGAMQLAHQVGLINDVVIRRDALHDRCHHESDAPCNDEDIDVWRQHLIGSRRDIR